MMKRGPNVALLSMLFAVSAVAEILGFGLTYLVRAFYLGAASNTVISVGAPVSEMSASTVGIDGMSALAVLVFVLVQTGLAWAVWTRRTRRIAPVALACEVVLAVAGLLIGDLVTVLFPLVILLTLVQPSIRVLLRTPRQRS
jgi:hypothetical protein